MFELAVKTLTADRGKMFTALVGVVFSIVLVNIQGGLFLGLIHKASMLVDHGRADIWVGHKKIHNVDFPRDIPRRWVNRVRSIPGVARAEAYLVGVSQVTLPSGGFEPVFVIGVDESTLMGNVWNLSQGRPDDVRKTDGIIVDELEDGKLDAPQIGDLREINGVRARVVAKSRGVMGFLVNPYVFTTYSRAVDYTGKSPHRCSYFLVQVEPGVDPHAVCRAIKGRIPGVEAFTRDEYSRVSVNYWMTRTGLGISFGAATLLGLAVGMIVVAQTLYALVLDRLGEFATLKAIGAKEHQIVTILLTQAFVMAILGSVTGLAIVAVAQHFFSTPRAPISIPAELAFGSCLLVTLICIISSLLPYSRIRKVDPVMVMR